MGHFHSSDPARRLLHKTQEEMKLPMLNVVQEVDTRWNSEFAMLERLLILKDPLSQIMIDYDVITGFTASEWKVINELVCILKPVNEATTISSGAKYPTLSMIIPLIEGMLDNITKSTAKSVHCSGIQFSRELVRAIKSRFPLLKSNFTLMSSMYLDPRFKNIFMDDHEERKVRDFLVSQLPAQKLVEPEGKEWVFFPLHN